jgi:hypothetical protein
MSRFAENGGLIRTYHVAAQPKSSEDAESRLVTSSGRPQVALGPREVMDSQTRSFVGVVAAELTLISGPPPWRIPQVLHCLRGLQQVIAIFF